jgi:predicted homoserine dehydrogenase-like protein
LPVHGRAFELKGAPATIPAEAEAMNLSSMLAERAAAGRPVRMGLIGAGKFGSMILAQARHIQGLHVVGVVDLDVGKARAALGRVGWPEERYAAPSLDAAVRTGATCVLDSAEALAACGAVECLVEATGHPIAGVRHALQAIEHGKHLVMVNVEADALCGPLLAGRARAKGLVYSMAYGDQPALICELVDWVRACGFELVAAGKGMKFEPRYRYSTPDTVWSFYGWSEEQAAKADVNPKMFNSFTDGTKSAIEMVAVANGTGLDCPDDGLAFPPAGVHDLARVFRPAADGGRLAHAGLVEIASSREPDGREVFNNLRWGVFVTFKAPNAYARDCFAQYGLLTDPSGWYASLWRPFHLIGLEAGVSVLSAVLRGEPTGTAKAFRGDAVAVAKRDLQAGEVLDGEGGHLVRADAVPAARSLAAGGLPIGLAHDVRLTRPVAKDAMVRFADVALERDQDDVVALRREMERGSVRAA